MDDLLMRALAAAARAFADEIERGLPVGPESGAAPVAGSQRSMFEVLQSVGRINEDQKRGATDEEMRAIARRAGMDPRGMAGYYAANLLEKRDDGTRWLSQSGRNRLRALSSVVILDSAPTSRSESSASPNRDEP